MRSALAKSPAMPAEYEKADVLAIQACVAGIAEPEQQKRAIDWIINHAAATYQFHFYPTDRDTAFALGRGFVGQSIVKMTRLNVSREE